MHFEMCARCRLWHACICRIGASAIDAVAVASHASGCLALPHLRYRPKLASPDMPACLALPHHCCSAQKDRLYMVMELVDGGTLVNIIR